MRVNKMPRCPYLHTECMAYIRSHCRALTSAKFPNGKGCPFYKTKAQNAKEDEMVIEKLQAEGKGALLALYRGKKYEH